MRKTKLISLVQVYLYCHFYNRAYARFESDKFLLLFWKNPENFRFRIRRRRDHPHCCGSETRVDDVILLHCSLFLALLTQSAIVIPVHSFTSSTHRLLGLPRALSPSTYP